MVVGYVRALMHPSTPAPVKHRRLVLIGAVMWVLFVASFILSPGLGEALLVAAAAIMVATNLDLLRRDRKVSDRSGGSDTR